MVEHILIDRFYTVHSLFILQGLIPTSKWNKWNKLSVELFSFLGTTLYYIIK